MFERKFYWSLLTIVIVSFFVGIFFGKYITYESQARLLDTLRDSSAVLMAVLGVWLAVMCPDILPKLFSGESVKVDSIVLNRIQTLIVPLMIYSTIICFEILIPWLALILKQIPYCTNNIFFMRQISFVIISFLCLVQILSLLLVLVPVEMLSLSAKVNNIRERFLSR